jgi:protein associated with RNAse G/E
VASPARRSAEGIEYCDYELDVVKRVGQPPEVIDEDEFVAAISQYGYSAELQAECRRAVLEAVALVEGWRWPGAE